MEQQPNKFIAVAYELFTIDEDGTAHKEQQVTAEEPFSFISGFGITHKEFENNIYPLQTGDTFDFTLTPQQGFGEYIDEAVARIPRETFFVDGKFDDQHCFVGAIIPLQNQEGQHFNGIVMDIDNENVTVDLNHPWAGKGLNFKGTIVESREATNDEVMNLIKQLTSGCGHRRRKDSCQEVPSPPAPSQVPAREEAFPPEGGNPPQPTANPAREAYTCP